jgi:hypothetical protein
MIAAGRCAVSGCDHQGGVRPGGVPLDDHLAGVGTQVGGVVAGPGEGGCRVFRRRGDPVLLKSRGGAAQP